MIFIDSGKALHPELRGEFGDVPSCMLPLANQKLIEHQVRTLRNFFPDEALVVLLPQGYAASARERALLEALGVSIALAAPEMAERITAADPQEPVRVLRGDALCGLFPRELDLIALLQDAAEGPEPLFFAFASAKELARCLFLTDDLFADALLLYEQKHPLRRVPMSGCRCLCRLDSYFEARSALTTQRPFNALRVDAGVVTKSGTPPEKIEAEACWYRNLPDALKQYTPRLLAEGSRDGQPFYQVAYLPFSPLNELFVHGRNPVSFWEQAFALIREFFAAAAAFTGDETAIRQAARRLYEDKTRQRLSLFTAAEGIDETRTLQHAGKALPPLRDILEDCLARTLALPVAPGVLHGDLCLSNILIDPASRKISLIDPRGMDHDNRKTIYGDRKYDLAKLAHSCIGLYDCIISGYYSLQTDGPYRYHLHIDLDERLTTVQRVFQETPFLPQCSVPQIMPLTVLLFLSMLPLHCDSHDKQRALFANALRLYQQYLLE